MLQNWIVITKDALAGVWIGFVNYALVIIVAIIVLMIGWAASVFIGKIVTEVLKRVKFNQLLQKGNWDETLAKANIKVDASSFIGAIVKWILVIVTLQITVGILGWTAFDEILVEVVSYLPNVFVAVVFFVTTVIIADIVEKIVRISVERVRVGYGHMASAIVKWAIWIFAIFIILEQLNIGGSIPSILAWGIVGFLALAGGLAFGLGGKDAAAKVIEDLRQKMQK